MFYTIYQTTNVVNNKIYIGKHQTNNLDDGYIGSGNLLQDAIKKYGIENFKREILFTFSSEQEMNAKEAELVTEDFCDRKNTYNICVGGKGGWSYVNKILTEEQRIKAGKLGGFSKFTPEERTLYGKRGLVQAKLKSPESFRGRSWNRGKNLSQEHRNKIGIKSKINQAGSKNSQFGIKRKWINDGIKTKRILESETLPEGWKYGRL